MVGGSSRANNNARASYQIKSCNYCTLVSCYCSQHCTPTLVFPPKFPTISPLLTEQWLRFKQPGNYAQPNTDGTWRGFREANKFNFIINVAFNVSVNPDRRWATAGARTVRVRVTGIVENTKSFCGAGVPLLPSLNGTAWPPLISKWNSCIGKTGNSSCKITIARIVWTRSVKRPRTVESKSSSNYRRIFHRYEN